METVRGARDLMELRAHALVLFDAGDLALGGAALHLADRENVIRLIAGVEAVHGRGLGAIPLYGDRCLRQCHRPRQEGEIIPARRALRRG
jgi:hypothetical protein